MQPIVLSQPLSQQFSSLLLLGLAVACVSWTITHEEIFRETREFCEHKSRSCKPFYQREILLPVHLRVLLQPLCDGAVFALTHFQMLYQGWRGFVISEFALVWIANVYMGAYNRLRLEIKAENLSIAEQTKTPD